MLKVRATNRIKMKMMFRGYAKLNPHRRIAESAKQLIKRAEPTESYIEHDKMELILDPNLTMEDTSDLLVLHRREHRVTCLKWITYAIFLIEASFAIFIFSISAATLISNNAVWIGIPFTGLIYSTGLLAACGLLCYGLVVGVSRYHQYYVFYKFWIAFFLFVIIIVTFVKNKIMNIYSNTSGRIDPWPDTRYVIFDALYGSLSLVFAITVRAHAIRTKQSEKPNQVNVKYVQVPNPVLICNY